MLVANEKRPQVVPTEAGATCSRELYYTTLHGDNAGRNGTCSGVIIQTITGVVNKAPTARDVIARGKEAVSKLKFEAPTARNVEAWGIAPGRSRARSLER